MVRHETADARPQPEAMYRINGMVGGRAGAHTAHRRTLWVPAQSYALLVAQALCVGFSNESNLERPILPGLTHLFSCFVKFSFVTKLFSNPVVTALKKGRKLRPKSRESRSVQAAAMADTIQKKGRPTRSGAKLAGAHEYPRISRTRTRPRPVPTSPSLF